MAECEATVKPSNLGPERARAIARQVILASREPILAEPPRKRRTTKAAA